MISPEAIDPKEWEEIMSLPEIIDAWELDENDTIATFVAQVYGAKFIYPNPSDAQHAALFLLSDGTPEGINMMIRRHTNNSFSVMN